MAASPTGSPFAKLPREENVAVPEAGPEPRQWHRSTLSRLGVCVTVGVAATTALFAWKGRCLVGFSEGSLTSFAELDDNIKLRPGVDEDALRDWLSVASSAGRAADGVGAGPAINAEAQAAIQKAVSADDPEEAQRVVNRAMKKAFKRTMDKRRELAKDISSKRHLSHTALKYLSPQQKVYTAKCSFDVLQSMNALGAAAANIHDAIKTCGGEGSIGDANNVRGKVCVMSIGYAFSELAHLTGRLAMAVNDCATTILPNDDAFCVSGISDLVYSLGQITGSSAMVAASCNNKFFGKDVPEGATSYEDVAGDLGANGGDPLTAWATTERRLEELNSTVQAPQRQLVFGGGKASNNAHCALEATSVAWAIGKAAVYITQAIHGSIGPLGKCPPSGNLYGTTRWGEGPAWEQSFAFCALNLISVVNAFAEIAHMLNMAMVSCSNELHLSQVCGAGVTGIISGVTGLASMGGFTHAGCNLLKQAAPAKGMKVAKWLDKFTNEGLSRAIGKAGPYSKVGEAGAKISDFIQKTGIQTKKNKGRRLEDAVVEGQIDVEDLKKQFESPEELWKTMGYDLNDKSAAFRQDPHKEMRWTQAELILEEDARDVGLRGGKAEECRDP